MSGERPEGVPAQLFRVILEALRPCVAEGFRGLVNLLTQDSALPEYFTEAVEQSM
ncbi:hypothetical protein ABTX60_14805 [Streptomyces sp. NPDC126510]|uniref:hypothetical protein n=1 Tax=Streptomyces sp. NPDC126510 TaxID=3155317 RepID=UPI0033246CC2